MERFCRPFLVGVMSDIWGLQHAMAVIPAFSVLAAAFFMIATRYYDHDVHKVEKIRLDSLEDVNQVEGVRLDSPPAKAA